MPVWVYTYEPCHLMYSSFSSPFISNIFVFQEKNKNKKTFKKPTKLFFLFQSFILQHVFRRKTNRKSYGKFLKRDVCVCACCMWSTVKIKSQINGTWSTTSDTSMHNFFISLTSWGADRHHDRQGFAKKIQLPCGRARQIIKSEASMSQCSGSAKPTASTTIDTCTCKSHIVTMSMYKYSIRFC